MTRPSRRAQVLIAGGGIGGLCTAIALARRGIATTVLERNDFTEESGAGIQLGPNATASLRALGALGAVEAAAFKPEALTLTDGPSGRTLATMPLGAAIEARHGAPYLTLHRADLHAALLSSCRGLEAIQLRANFEVAEIEPLADGVAARSAQGVEVDGTALVAADGLWSKLRALVAPEARLRFAGAIAWRALVPRDALGTAFDAANVGLWVGPRAHIVHYPVRGGGDINVVAVVEGGAAQQGWNVQADASGLTRNFQDWAGPVRDLIAGVRNWRCWSLYSLDPLPSWSDGRIVLLGDAAHPVLPYLAQGAGLAIEDAAALAASLDTSSDAPTAFQRYESLRRARAAKVQERAWRFGFLYHLKGVLASARNAVLRNQRPDKLLANFDWLYAPDRTRG